MQNEEEQIYTIFTNEQIIQYANISATVDTILLGPVNNLIPASMLDYPKPEVA